MGYEYRATCSPDDGWLSGLYAAVASDDRFVVHARGPEHLSLRIAKYPLQDRWPQDLEVRVGQDGVYVVFYNATATERAEILDIVREALARVGCAARFEEL